MKINTSREVYAAKVRYPHTAPFKYFLFDNKQAAEDYKDWWAQFAEKRCVGAVEKLYLNDIIPNDIKIYKSKDEATRNMFNSLRVYIDGSD